MVRALRSLVTGEAGGLGRMYMAAVTLFFLVGIGLAALLRLELASSEPLLLGDGAFARLLSMHGIVMLFLVIFPAIPGVLGNLLLPSLLEARELSFPRVNLIGFYLYLAGGLALLWSLEKGGAEGTWMLLPPFSTAASASNLAALAGVFLVAAGLLCLAVTFVVSFHGVRRRSWSELSVFAWSLYCAEFVLLFALPVLMGLIVLLVSGHYLGGSVFDMTAGGDPALYRRLFWMSARPAFYATILPAIGLISEIADRRRKPVLRGDRALFGSIGAIALLGLFGAGAHWVTADASGPLTLASLFVNFLTVVPFFVILIRWIQVFFWAGKPWDAPLTFALTSVLLALAGGLSGLILGGPAANPHAHATLFVAGHLHYLLAGSLLAAYLAGIHHWWSDLMGRQYPDPLGMVGAILLFAGVNATFLPQFLAGLGGLPRRLPRYPPEFEAYQILSSAGMTLLVVGYLLPMIYLLVSLRFGRRADSSFAFGVHE